MMNRFRHIPKADLYRVYDAFLRGWAAMTSKVEFSRDHEDQPVMRNVTRLASLGPDATNRPRGSWVVMLCEVDTSGSTSGSASPIAYLRHDGTVHGVVRDYSVEHINNLSLLVGNNDVLTMEIKRDGQGNVARHRPIWTWGESAGGGREVSTMDYLVISAPLMTQVYRLTKTPKPTQKTPRKP
jgi:hypothetical protein